LIRNPGSKTSIKKHYLRGKTKEKGKSREKIPEKKKRYKKICEVIGVGTRRKKVSEQRAALPRAEKSFLQAAELREKRERGTQKITGVYWRRAGEGGSAKRG